MDWSLGEIISGSRQLEVDSEKVHMLGNNVKHSTFALDKMLVETKHWAFGLYVDIVTIGYFS